MLGCRIANIIVYTNANKVVDKDASRANTLYSTSPATILNIREGTPMPGSTVRISSASRKVLRELAVRKAESMQKILDEAIEEYRRRHFLDEANRAYAALRRKPAAWKAEVEERKEWDATLADGLDDQ